MDTSEEIDSDPSNFVPLKRKKKALGKTQAGKKRRDKERTSRKRKVETEPTQSGARGVAVNAARDEGPSKSVSCTGGKASRQRLATLTQALRSQLGQLLHWA